MNVYVAAKYECKEQVREMYNKLVVAGHKPGYDWTQEDASKFRGDELAEYMNKCAENCLESVAESDVLIIYPHADGKGQYVEMGGALMRGIPIIAIGDFTSCVFFYCDDVVRVDSDADALDVLATWQLRGTAKAS